MDHGQFTIVLLGQFLAHSADMWDKILDDDPIESTDWDMPFYDAPAVGQAILRYVHCSHRRAEADDFSVSSPSALGEVEEKKEGKMGRVLAPGMVSGAASGESQPCTRPCGLAPPTALTL